MFESPNKYTAFANQEFKIMYYGQALEKYRWYRLYYPKIPQIIVGVNYFIYPLSMWVIKQPYTLYKISINHHYNTICSLWLWSATSTLSTGEYLYYFSSTSFSSTRVYTPKDPSGPYHNSITYQ